MLRFRQCLVLLPVLLMTVAGCSARYTGIEATDLSTVTVGSQRADIEGVLGSPLQVQNIGAKTAATYEYDGGLASQALPAHAGYAGPLLPLILLGQSIQDQDLAEGQRKKLVIAYNAADQVDYLLFYDSQIVEKARRAESGGVLNQAEILTSVRDPVSEAYWVCRAANSNFGFAQYALGRVYDGQLGEGTTDQGEALRWFQLASLNGYPNSALKEAPSDLRNTQALPRDASAYCSSLVQQLLSEKSPLAWGRPFYRVAYDASCGDASSQFTFGKEHSWDTTGLQPDNLVAYFWLRLAHETGDETVQDKATERLAKLQSKVSQEDIETSEEWLSDWSPPSYCS